jgi:hypothetical protein
VTPAMQIVATPPTQAATGPQSTAASTAGFYPGASS